MLTDIPQIRQEINVSLFRYRVRTGYILKLFWRGSCENVPVFRIDILCDIPNTYVPRFIDESNAFYILNTKVLKILY